MHQTLTLSNITSTGARNHNMQLHLQLEVHCGVIDYKDYVELLRKINLPEIGGKTSYNRLFEAPLCHNKLQEHWKRIEKSTRCCGGEICHLKVGDMKRFK